jgi:hypothetical protein
VWEAAHKWLNEGPNSACSTQRVADNTLRTSFPQNLAPQTTRLGKGFTRTCQAQGIMTRTNGHQICSINREGFLMAFNAYVHFPLLLHKTGKNLIGFCPIHVFNITPNKCKIIFNTFSYRLCNLIINRCERIKKNSKIFDVVLTVHRR